MIIEDIQLVAVSATHNPTRRPKDGVETGTYWIERIGNKHFARGASNQSFPVKQYVLQTTQALVEVVVEQLRELSRNADKQPVFVRFNDATPTNLDGWYIFSDFEPDFSTVQSGGVSVQFSLKKVAQKGATRSIGYGSASMAVAIAGNNTALGLPPGAVATPTTITRTGADGTHTIGVALPTLGASVQVPGGIPDFTRRCRIFDRNGGTAGVPGTGAISFPNWVEVYGPDHAFVGDLILTNGIAMVVFSAGAVPTVYHYIAGAWTQTWTLTMANAGLATQQSAQVHRLGAEFGTVKTQLAIGGNQFTAYYYIDRGFPLVEIQGTPTLGTGVVTATSPKTFKLVLTDATGLDVALAETAIITPVTYAMATAMSADATMTWLPVFGGAALTSQATATGTTISSPSTARLNTQRVFVSASTQTGNSTTTAKFQKEAEAMTLTGAGATSQADAAASSGNAVRMVGTEIVEGASLVPGTDGVGLSTGTTYTAAARVRSTGSTDAQVARIVTPGGAVNRLVASGTYGWVGVSPVSTAALAQSVQVLRARYRDIVIGDGAMRLFHLNDTTTTAVDSISGGNGTYGGGYTQSQTGVLTLGGDTDNGVLFNGTTGNIDFGVNGPNGSAAYSFEGWFKTSTAAGIQTVVSFGNGTATANYAALTLNAGVPTYGTFNDDLSSGMASQADGLWHHIVGVYDPAITTYGTMYIYVDGVLKATGTHTVAPVINGGFGTIGARWVTTVKQDWFNGTLDEIALYQVKLSGNQIKSHYNSARALGQLWADETALTPLLSVNDGPADHFVQWAADKAVGAVAFL